jgi:hypothetical protein
MVLLHRVECLEQPIQAEGEAGEHKIEILRLGNVRQTCQVVADLGPTSPENDHSFVCFGNGGNQEEIWKLPEDLTSPSWPSQL